MSDKQQTTESDSQVSTGIINSCKSCWWARESWETVGRYWEWKIHLNKPNQSNIHRWHLSQKEKKKHLWKKKNAIKQQNKSQRGRQEDGAKMMVLYCSWRPLLSCSWQLRPGTGPQRKDSSACSCQKASASSISAPMGSTPRDTTKIRAVLALENRVNKDRERKWGRMSQHNVTKCNWQLPFDGILWNRVFSSAPQSKWTRQVTRKTNN